MAPMYKLIYFDVKGLGECIKYILQYKKIEYELETIINFTGPGPWENIKSSFPFGHLPVLEVKGKKLYQSLAICQYLAEEHDLKIGDHLEDALLLGMANTMLDLIMKVCNYYYIVEKTTKAIFKENVFSNLLPLYMERLEDILKEKGNYFGGKLTWVDFYIVSAFEAVNGMLETDLITDEFPNLQQHRKKIWNMSGIKEYIETRPLYNR